jgi:hypothetical protein
LEVLLATLELERHHLFLVHKFNMLAVAVLVQVVVLADWARLAVEMVFILAMERAH